MCAMATLIFLTANGVSFGIYSAHNRAARRAALDAHPPVTLTVAAGAARAVGVTFPGDVEPGAIDPDAVVVLGPMGQSVPFRPRFDE